MSNNVLSADNQQERSRSSLDPWYITGFVEGEGTFHIAFYKDPRMKQGVKVIPEFHVNQSYLRLQTLEGIQKYFDCGYIKENHKNSARDTTYVYVVRDREDLLKKIIPFFYQYPLHSVKRESFHLFARVVLLVSKGKHLEQEGMKAIIQLAYRMNVDGKYRKRNKNQFLQFLKSSETIRLDSRKKRE